MKNDSKHTPHIDKSDANRDPITGTPGAHPVGVGIGAAGGGAAAGAAAGAVAGPVGAAVGAVVGGVAGGLAGKAVGEKVNPTVEDAFWKENYSKRPYVQSGEAYDKYQPAYRYGWEGRSKHAGKRFDEVERELEQDWERRRDSSALDWKQLVPPFAMHGTETHRQNTTDRKRGKRIHKVVDFANCVFLFF